MSIGKIVALSLILLSFMGKREQSDLIVLLGATLVQESIRKHIGASVKCFSQSCSVVQEHRRVSKRFSYVRVHPKSGSLHVLLAQTWQGYLLFPITNL